jgi:hypothetical protein
MLCVKPSYVRTSVTQVSDPTPTENDRWSYLTEKNWQGCITAVYTYGEETTCKLYSSFDQAAFSVLDKKYDLEHPKITC